MEELEKVATPMTVREYLNTLSTETFSELIIGAVLHLECGYMETELDALDINYCVNCDMVDWFESSYCKDKELLPVVKSGIYCDKDETEDLDD